MEFHLSSTQNSDGEGNAPGENPPVLPRENYSEGEADMAVSSGEGSD